MKNVYLLLFPFFLFGLFNYKLVTESDEQLLFLAMGAGELHPNDSYSRIDFFILEKAGANPLAENVTGRNALEHAILSEDLRLVAAMSSLTNDRKAKLKAFNAAKAYYRNWDEEYMERVGKVLRY